MKGLRFKTECIARAPKWVAALNRGDAPTQDVRSNTTVWASMLGTAVLLANIQESA